MSSGEGPQGGAISQSENCRRQRATRQLLGQGVAFQSCIDPDLARRCLYQFLETTDHGLLGASGAGNRIGLCQLRMVQCQRQNSANTIDSYAGVHWAAFLLVMNMILLPSVGPY